MKKTLLSLAMVSLGLVSVPALALNAATDAQDVTIQEGAIPGTPTNQVIADQLSGQYNEVFSTTGPGTFNTLAYFNAGGWFNNTVAQSVYLNSPGTNGYGLYALFQSNGTFTSSGGSTTFTGTAGSLQLWADPNQDSTKALPGSAIGGTIANITLGGNGEDLLLGTASLLTAANGHSFFGTGANGDFELVFSDWALQASGESYFIAPRPFYMVLDLNGNFQSFDPTSATDITLPASSANAFFAVPEPGTIALLGIGLLGMGMGLRRKA